MKKRKNDIRKEQQWLEESKNIENMTIDELIQMSNSLLKKSEEIGLFKEKTIGDRVQFVDFTLSLSEDLKKSYLTELINEIGIVIDDNVTDVSFYEQLLNEEILMTHKVYFPDKKQTIYTTKETLILL